MLWQARSGLIAGRAAFDPVAAAPTDPHFASVVFLAGWEGVDGATTYSEEKNGRAGTFVGNAQIDNAEAKFGSTSVKFDGSGDIVTFADNADWDLADANSDPYTIEGWVKFNVLDANNRGVLSHQGSAGGNNAWNLGGSSTIGEFSFNFTTNGSTAQNVTTSGASLTTGVWYAWCVDHDSSGKIRIYIDGVMLGSATPANSTIFNSTGALTVGAQSEGSTVDMNGWVDEVRITKGVARYASDSGYTPATSAFPRS